MSLKRARPAGAALAATLLTTASAAAFAVPAFAQDQGEAVAALIRQGEFWRGRGRKDLSDEEFCDSDVRFHRTLVDAAGNAMLSFQMAGVIEALQPVLNKIINRVRDRRTIVDAHAAIGEAVERRDLGAAQKALWSLTDYIRDQAIRAQAERESAVKPRRAAV